MCLKLLKKLLKKRGQLNKTFEVFDCFQPFRSKDLNSSAAYLTGLCYEKGYDIEKVGRNAKKYFQLAIDW